MRPPLLLGEEMEPLALYAFRQSRYLWPVESRGVLLAVLPTRDAGIDAQQSSNNPVETGSFLCPIQPARSIQNGGKMKGRLIKRYDIEFSALRNWITTCQQQHDHSCCPPTTQFRHRPKFVDCMTRIIKDGPVDGGYVALSYVYGNVPIAGDIIDGSALRENLPATIEDAITVTEKLGYRYLWIEVLHRTRRRRKDASDTANGRYLPTCRGSYHCCLWPWSDFRPPTS